MAERLVILLAAVREVLASLLAEDPTARATIDEVWERPEQWKRD